VANILIVDDDRRIAETVALRLKSNGHAIRWEPNGERALQIVEGGDIQLLILDVMIPGLSGFEVCRRIRGNANQLALPILFLSAMDGPEEIQHGLAQGGDDFITKPFNLDVLVKRVENLLNVSAAMQLTDELTSLPAAKAIKIDVQNTIIAKRAFDLIYMEITRLAEFSRFTKAEDRAKALRHFARGIGVCRDEMTVELFHVGHLGGGHFLCLIDPGKGEELSIRMNKLWLRHLPRFYADIGHEKAFLQARAMGPNPRQSPIPLLDALFCITHYDPESSLNCSAMLETLSNIRRGALESSGSGIHLDRRN